VNPPDKLDQFLEARRLHDRVKKQAASCYDAMRSIEAELVAEMQEKDMRAFTTLDGTKVHLRRYETCTVTQENEMLVREWLRETHGDEYGFERSSLNKPAIVGFIRGCIENGKFNETELPDFLAYRTGFGAVVTEAKVSA
jgi:hypothetical protein